MIFKPIRAKINTGKYIFFLILIFSKNTFSQNTTDTAAIKKQLTEILDRDQKTRSRGDSSQFMEYIDSTNQIYAEALISKYGWLGKSFVGVSGNQAIFLVIQHAGIKKQEKYLPLLIQSVKDGESRESDLALLQDRVLMRHGEKQIYGSQLIS